VEGGVPNAVFYGRHTVALLGGLVAWALAGRLASADNAWPLLRSKDSLLG
jgi:hypothetical protein